MDFLHKSMEKFQAKYKEQQDTSINEKQQQEKDTVKPLEYQGKNVTEMTPFEKALKKPRVSSYVTAVQKHDDQLTENDKKVIERVQEKIEQEQDADIYIGSLSKCYITGCLFHVFGRNGLDHYQAGRSSGAGFPSISSMPERIRKGYEAYKNCPGCSCVEIYERHICIVSGGGQTTVIEE